jgi:hypothetical protein
MRVVFTYGVIHTSSEFVQMGYSKDVYQLKKESKSLKDAIHHQSLKSPAIAAAIARDSRWAGLKLG